MKDKKQDVRQNAKIEDKKLEQVRGGQWTAAKIGLSTLAKIDAATITKNTRCC